MHYRASFGLPAYFSGQLSGHLLAQLSNQLCIQLLKYLPSKVYSQLCKENSQLLNRGNIMGYSRGVLLTLALL